MEMNNKRSPNMRNIMITSEKTIASEGIISQRE